jgi:subtilase family serine protease
MRKLNYADEISTNYLIEINEIESSPNRKYLSESQYFKFFKLGLMSQDEVLSVYKEKGLSVQDANNLFLTLMQGVSNETT